MKDFAFVFHFIMPHHHHTDKMFPRPCLYICTICLFVVESDNSVDSVSDIQSGASSQAKIGGAYFSGVTGSIQDPIAVPGPCEVTEP